MPEGDRGSYPVTSGREPGLARLARQPVTGLEPELSGLRARAEAMRGPLVLYADDDPDYVAAVSRFLELHGFRVCGAYDGRSALHLAGELQPDVIVTDIEKPDMSGLEMLDELKARPALCHIPVVVHTAYGGNYWSQLSVERGAAAFSSKPWEPEDLIATLVSSLEPDRRAVVGLARSDRP